MVSELVFCSGGRKIRTQVEADSEKSWSASLSLVFFGGGNRTDLSEAAKIAVHTQGAQILADVFGKDLLFMTPKIQFLSKLSDNIFSSEIFIYMQVKVNLSSFLMCCTNSSFEHMWSLFWFRQVHEHWGTFWLLKNKIKIKCLNLVI